MLEARIEHLEAALEGLQDAVYRQAQLAEEKHDELRARIEPEQMAIDLAQDALQARAVMAGSPSVEELLAEARYHRHRYDLYKAKMYGSRPTRMTRLRELERTMQGAEARLRRAQQAGRPPDHD